MATTSIWKVANHLSRVVEYAKDADKTVNPKWSDVELQAMRDVMNYALNDFKTEHQYFVTGLNCDPQISRDQMQMTKQQFRKTDGILAFHGYQSFAEGEVPAELAHKIGIELAERLWPDFQVVVATHLNTKCYHNHFVLNSVSFVHGGKFNNCKETYRRMRQVSDDLCRKYSLSVVVDSKGRSPKHYSEWQAENVGKITWRSAIREDVNKAVTASMSFPAFIRNLKDMDYEVKTGVKYMAVRPPGKERFVRLRSMGESYTEEAIKRRILLQQTPNLPPMPMTPTVPHLKYKGDFTLHKVTFKSIRALYFYYLYKLCRAQHQPESVHYLIREDLRHLDKLTAQAKFLNRHGMDTAEHVKVFRIDTEQKIEQLMGERRKLYIDKRRKGVSAERVSEIEARIGVLSGLLKELRRDVKMCSDVIERIAVMRKKKERIGELEWNTNKKHNRIDKERRNELE